VVFWFKVGTSADAMVPQTGALAVPAVPVWVRNPFVEVVFPGTRTATPETVPATMSPGEVIGFTNDTPPSHPAVTTCAIVKFAACATGTLDSAPRVTFQVVPDVLVTRMISEGACGSPMWNWVDPVDADGHPMSDATVHISVVPLAGASVPPEETVVEGLFSKTSVGMARHPRTLVSWYRGTMAMTLRLEPDLAKRLRRAAFEREVSQTSIVEEAVRRELDRLEAEE
jgi:hypothetical protein